MFRYKAAFFFFIVGCAYFSIYAQSPSAPTDINLVSTNFYSNSPLGRTLWNVAFKKQLTPTEQKKLFYFENWQTQGVINSEYKIKRINYSFYDEALVFKMSSDSIFLFDKASVDHFMINQKRFKKFYLGGTLGSKYLEVLYGSPDGKIRFLKRYYVSIRKAEIDPLMFKKAKLDIARLSEYYLLKEKGYPLEIKLNKKDFFKYFKKEADILAKLAKEHKLSLRKEKDIVQLLGHLEDQPSE